MKIKRILVPLDGSENSLRSLKHALDLANQCKTSVIVLHVVTDMSLFAAVHAIIVGEDKWPSYVRDLMKDVRKVVRNMEIPYEEIVTFADSKNNEIDLIVMGYRGSSFPKEVILGSTTNFVIHKSKTPVLVIK